MKKHISILLFAMTLAISACSELEDRTTTGSSSLFVPHLFTAEELFPSGDVEPFVILPRNGWEVRYGEVIVFKALLLDDETVTYRDVTFDSNCKFVCSSTGAVSRSTDPTLPCRMVRKSPSGPPSPAATVPSPSATT